MTFSRTIDLFRGIERQTQRITGLKLVLSLYFHFSPYFLGNFSLLNLTACIYLEYNFFFFSIKERLLMHRSRLQREARGKRAVVEDRERVTNLV